MTVAEAEKFVREFDESRQLSEEDIFMFTEAMEFLIRERKRPEDMMYLGGFYYELKNFDLALKYYEMAASLDYEPAYECLGYVWYYGRTGTRDFKKAFLYYNKSMMKGNLTSTYKVADMYKNGYYVEKDQATYEQIIEDLYPKVRKCRDVFDPVPEVFTRLARIRKDHGEYEEAANLYLEAKNWLGQRITFNAFWGNLNIMKWLIDDLYDIIEFDPEEFDFFDLFYLLKSPHKLTFRYEGETFEVISEMEGGECNVCCNGKWYHSRDDFFKEAVTSKGIKLTAIHQRLKHFAIIE